MLLNFEHLKTFYSALRQKMKNFRGNWEQNDPGADDYIKNRPFYEKIRSVITVNPKAELDFSYANTCDWGQTKQGFIHEGLGEFEFAIKLDTSYTVVFDGKEYNLFAVQEDQYSNIILGNGAFVGDANKDNGLPFVIGNYSLGNEHTYIIVGDNRRHSFEVKIVDRDLKKLDKKYLPDDLTEGFADVAKTGSYNDLVDAPEVFDDVVRYNNQALTVQQQNIARANIDAASNSDVVSLANITAKTSDLEEVKIAAANMAAVVLAEAQADASNKSAVVLAEAQKGISEVDAKLDTKASIEALNSKVDKVDGKDLSTNDYTTDDKEKLANIEDGAQVNVQSDWNQVDDTQPDYIKNKPVLNSNFMILVDQVNGYDYVVQMMNGDLVSFCRCSSIDVTVPPNKRGYMEGEEIDTTGMVVSAVCQDGSTRQIENYTYSPKVMTPEVEQLDIQYVECGEVYTTSTTIGLKGIADVLIDFEYTPNGDGTYTLTSWSGTLDGQPSTELIVPDNDKLIV